MGHACSPERPRDSEPVATSATRGRRSRSRTVLEVFAVRKREFLVRTRKSSCTVRSRTPEDAHLHRDSTNTSAGVRRWRARVEHHRSENDLGARTGGRGAHGGRHPRRGAHRTGRRARLRDHRRSDCAVLQGGLTQQDSSDTRPSRDGRRARRDGSIPGDGETHRRVRDHRPRAHEQPHGHGDGAHGGSEGPTRHGYDVGGAARSGRVSGNRRYGLGACAALHARCGLPSRGARRGPSRGRRIDRAARERRRATERLRRPSRLALAVQTARRAERTSRGSAQHAARLRHRNRRALGRAPRERTVRDLGGVWRPPAGCGRLARRRTHRRARHGHPAREGRHARKSSAIPRRDRARRAPGGRGIPEASATRARARARLAARRDGFVLVARPRATRGARARQSAIRTPLVRRTRAFRRSACRRRSGRSSKR